MALALSLSSLQQTNCTELVLTDTSGAYDVTTNPTGWGSATIPIDDGTVTYAELIIILPSGSSITIDIISNWEALTGLTSDPFGSGTSALALSYTLSSSIYLGTTTFTDGVYRITYRVGDGSTYLESTNKATITYNFAVYCGVECAIEQRVALVPYNYTCENCSNDFLEITMILWSIFQALKLAACTANIEKFNNILLTLQTALEEADCTCI